MAKEPEPFFKDAPRKSLDGFVLLMFICTSVALVITFDAWRSLDRLKREGIDRGYILHCPKTGKIAWSGECGDAVH